MNRRHADELTLSRAQLLNDGAAELVRDVDKGNLHRLLLLIALIVAIDDLSLRDCELKALAAHVLDEDREMQLTSAADLKAIRRELLDAKRDIRIELAQQAIAQVAGSDVLSFLPGERAVVDHEVHRNGRLGNLLKRDGLRRLRARNRVADVEV